MIIPFTYNILKKHPALMIMIHRDAHDFESGMYWGSGIQCILTDIFQIHLTPMNHPHISPMHCRRPFGNWLRIGIITMLRLQPWRGSFLTLLRSQDTIWKTFWIILMARFVDSLLSLLFISNKFQ